MAFNLDAVTRQYFDAEVAVNKILEDELKNALYDHGLEE